MLILEVITVGLSFCAFKILSGYFFNLYWLIILGGIDTLINLINLITLLFYKRRVIDACFLSLIVRLIKKPNLEKKNKWEYLGNSIDVLLSFTIVAFMVGGGYIPQLSPQQMTIWNISVVLNVLGAGLGQLTNSIKNLN